MDLPVHHDHDTPTSAERDAIDAVLGQLQPGR